MDWREEYQRRLTTAEEAMMTVEHGNLVVIPIAGPRTLPPPTLFSPSAKEHDARRAEGRRIDVFLTAVTPPDADGYVQFGAHNWNKRSYVRRAATTIAEVDPGLRPVCGDNRVHVSEISHFVEIPALQITRPMVDAWLRRVEDESLRGE